MSKLTATQQYGLNTCKRFVLNEIAHAVYDVTRDGELAEKAVASILRILQDATEFQSEDGKEETMTLQEATEIVVRLARSGISNRECTDSPRARWDEALQKVETVLASLDGVDR